MVKKLHKIKLKFNNFPLHKKIFILILTVILLTLSASFAGIKMVSSSYDKLLYKALAGSLSYSAANISTQLANVESMSNAIITNKNIQKNLITLTDETSSIKLQNARSMLDYLIFDYHQANRNSRIDYINLFNPNYTSESYSAKSAQTPDEIHRHVIAAANKKAGYPVWITDYCNEYGLFLGRDSRRVNKMKFETLGTLVVSIDLDKLIKASTDSILLSDSAQYIIYDNEKVIYHTKSLENSHSDEIRKELTDDYGVLDVGGRPFFCIRGSFSALPWQYICLIPYSNIARTLSFSILLSIAVILLAAALSLLLTKLLAISITKHFSRLLTKMDTFGKDESTLPTVNYDYSSRTDEIGVLHNQFDGMAEKIQQLIQQNYVNEILTRDARLKALEYQMNPHFLYNTLESVNWRAKAIGEKDISAMVEALGSLLRITLSPKNDSFTISNELELVRNYITIQNIRFEERLNYQEYIETEILDTLLPQLTIQPLVENAISHALEEITETCCIEIHGKLCQNDVIIDVINNGSQFEDNTLHKLETQEMNTNGFGIGLINIHRRLQLTYGAAYGLTLYNMDSEHAVSRITIPRRKQ